MRSGCLAACSLSVGSAAIRRSRKAQRKKRLNTVRRRLAVVALVLRMLLGKVAIECQARSHASKLLPCVASQCAKQRQVTPVGRQRVFGQALFQPQGINEGVDHRVGRAFGADSQMGRGLKLVAWIGLHATKLTPIRRGGLLFSGVNFAQLLFPDFSLILIGYLICRFTPLNRPVWTQVEQLVYFLFFPVLLFHSILKSPLDISAAGNLVGAGWALGLGGIAMAYSVPYWPGLKGHVAARQHAASAQIAFRFNSFIGLALAERLAGPPGLLAIALLIGVSVPLMNIGAVWPMARHAKRGFLGELVRNPLIIGTAGGLAANLAGLSMPGWAEPTVTRIGGASLALGPDGRRRRHATGRPEPCQVAGAGGA